MARMRLRFERLFRGRRQAWRCRYIALQDEIHDRLLVIGIERCGGFVEEHDRAACYKASGDVDPLLFPAGKRSGKKRP